MTFTNGGASDTDHSVSHAPGEATDGPQFLTGRPALVPDLERDRIWPLVVAAALAAVLTAGGTMALLERTDRSGFQAIESSDDSSEAGAGTDPAGTGDDESAAVPAGGPLGPATEQTGSSVVDGSTAGVGAGVSSGSGPAGDDGDPGPGRDGETTTSSSTSSTTTEPTTVDDTSTTDTTEATVPSTEADGSTTSSTAGESGSTSTTSTTTGEPVVFEGLLTEVFTDCASHQVLVDGEVVVVDTVSCDGGSWVKVGETVIRTSSGLVPGDQAWDNHVPTLVPGVPVIVTAVQDTGGGMPTLNCPSCRIDLG